jgi:hypothetical protein
VQRLGGRGVHRVQQLDLDNLGRAFCKDKAQGINYKHAELLRKPGPQRRPHPRRLRRLPGLTERRGISEDRARWLYRSNGGPGSTEQLI